MPVDIDDTFDRADSATSLGTTSDGNATWTTQTGVCGISSNAAYSPSLGASGVAIATVPGAADGDVSSTMTASGGGGPGPVFRFSDVNNYWAIQDYTGGSASFAGLWKIVGGTGTKMIALPSPAVSDVLKASFSGTGISLFRNGSQVGSTITDSFNQTATDVGIIFGTNLDRLDTFAFRLPVIVPAPPLLLVVQRAAITRASVW